MKLNKKILRFPWGLCLLNGLIYFFARLDIIENIYSGAAVGIIVNAALAVIPTAILMVISIVYQAFIYHILKFIIKNKVIWTVLFLLPGIVFGSQLFYWHLPAIHAQTILEEADLAPLPESAMGIKVFSWSTAFSGVDFLSFQADPDDIKAFINNSPVLKEKEFRQYSKEKMGLLQPEDYDRNKEKYQDENDYFQPPALAPAWYLAEIKGAGRRYSFYSSKIRHRVEVIVDEENNLVYVSLSFG